MGKLARLNASKREVNIQWMLAVKNDFSYDINEEIDGKKVSRHVEKISYVPFGTRAGVVLPFKSYEEITQWLRDFMEGIKDQKQVEQLLALDLRALGVKYVPSKRRRYDAQWERETVKQDIKVDLKSLKSSKIN